ncbi:hypothetical protein GCM10023222_40170 [Saccharopolyspora cebuensis]
MPAITWTRTRWAGRVWSGTASATPPRTPPRCDPGTGDGSLVRVIVDGVRGTLVPVCWARVPLTPIPSPRTIARKGERWRRERAS